jgi:hypothetical protein
LVIFANIVSVWSMEYIDNTHQRIFFILKSTSIWQGLFCLYLHRLLVSLYRICVLFAAD